jgi:two-component system NarL family sensor kinase
MIDQKDNALRAVDLLERERHFLAEELHEGLCQNLCGISMHLKLLERKFKSESAESREEFKALLGDVEETIDQIRFLYRTLKPPVTDGAALAAAIEELAKSKQIPFKREPGFLYHGETLSGPRATGLFRIAQEAAREATLNPAVKLLQITLTANNERIALLLNCEGAENLLETQSGAIMTIHAEEMGASLSMEPKSDAAAVSTIEFSLPIPSTT